MMAPAAESKAAWKKAREKQRGKERRTKEGEGGIEMDGGGGKEGRGRSGDQPVRTTVALFITPGITEFTIKIPRNAGIDGLSRATPRRRRYFQMNPPPFSSRSFFRDLQRRSHGRRNRGRSQRCLSSSSSSPLLSRLPSSPSWMTSTNSAGPTCSREDREFDFCMQVLVRSFVRSFLHSFDRSIANNQKIETRYQQEKPRVYASRKKMSETNKIQIRSDLTEI